MSGEDCESLDRGDSDGQKPDKMFTLKKWNAVAMWSWDVECDTCAICRVQVMDACLRCQGESKKDSYGKQDCVVVWGECNHSFHFCCMSLWVKQNNRCPLCQQEWSIQRMGEPSAASSRLASPSAAQPGSASNWARGASPHHRQSHILKPSLTSTFTNNESRNCRQTTRHINSPLNTSNL